MAPKWLSLFLNYSRKGLIEFANWQRNWIVKLQSSEENHKLICILDLIFFIHVKGILIHENASSTIYLVSCWEKQTCHQTLYQIIFSMQFAYMSACVFAANFEEFVNLYGESFTLHIIDLRQQNCRDFFYKGTHWDRKYFIAKFYFAKRSNLSCVLRNVILFIQTQFWVKLRFGKKKKEPQIGNYWVYFYRQRKKFSGIFHLYRISSLSGLARTLEIEYLVRHKITQSRTISRTIDGFSRTICPQNPAQF